MSTTSIPEPIDTRHFPLAAVVWPDRADGRSSLLRTVILIALGVVFLLDNLGIFEFRQALRYWPLLLIGLGVYMLYLRVTASKEPGQ